MDVSQKSAGSFGPLLAAATLLVVAGCTLQPVSGGLWRDKPPREQGSRYAASSAPHPARAGQAPALSGGGQLPTHEFLALMPYLQGEASWYGPSFHGKKTASGEVYNQYAFTAAHRVLPMGTRIRVENLANRRTVNLRINDRGPYKKGRILDLSLAGARRLKMVGQGTAPVHITVVQWPAGMDPALGLKPYRQFVVQVAAYPRRPAAESHRGRLQRDFGGLPLLVDELPRGIYSVVAGPYDDEHAARATARQLKKRGVSSLVRSYRK